MTVRWQDKHGRWQFGRLVTQGPKWAHVSQGDHIRRVAVEQVQPWPPEESDGD